MKKIFFLLISLALSVYAKMPYLDKFEHKDFILRQNEILRQDVVTDRAVIVDGELEGNCLSFGGDIVVRGRILGDIVSFGGKVFSSGEVSGEMVLIGSNGEFSGITNKNLVVLGGNVKFKTNAVVNGDIVLAGAEMQREENVKIKGQIIRLEVKPLSVFIKYIPELVKYFPKPKNSRKEFISFLYSSGIMWIGMAVFFSIILLFLAFILVPLAFFEKNVQTISGVIKGDFWTVVGIGTLISILLFPAFLVMLISILGIPLIPFAIILLLVACAMGFSGFVIVFIDKFFEVLKQKAPESVILRGVLGYVILFLFLLLGKLIPFIGLIFIVMFFVLLIAGFLSGLGAVFKTKMGTVGETGK